MTSDDRAELFDALITRFRAGEFGPVTFRARATDIGIGADDIDHARNLHIDECARNMRA